MITRFALLPLALIAGGSSRGTPRTHTVEIRAMAFQPAALHVRVGDTVVWINRDIVPHTATSSDSTWNVGPLQDGDSGRYVPRQDGKASYICSLHPTMKGTLIIEKE